MKNLFTQKNKCAAPGISSPPHPMHPSATRLMEDILNNGSGLRVKVTGKSMAPFIRCNDTVTIRKVSFFSLKPGDLVLYKNNEGCLILHRIIKKRSTSLNGTVLITKGDTMLIYDDPVKEKKVIGKIFSIEKKGKSGRLYKINLEKACWKTVSIIITLFQRIRSALLWKKIKHKITDL